MLGWLIERMTNVSPNNPIWRLELRQYHGQIQQLRWRAGRILPIIALICFLVAIVDSSTGFRTNGVTYLGFSLSFIISMLVMLPADFVYVQAALSSLNQYRPYGDWDLVALTEVQPIQILDGKFATALVRAWRGLMFEWVPRVVTAVMLISFYVIGSLLDLRSSEIGTFLGWVMLLSVMAIGYLAEPFWRMRTVTAFGMALSVVRLDPTQRVVLGACCVIAMRIVQIALFLGFAYTFAITDRFLQAYFGVLSFTRMILLSAFVGAMWCVVYFGYHILQHIALRFAERRIFQAEA